MAEIYELAKPFGRPLKFKTAESLWDAFIKYARWNDANPITLTQSKAQSQSAKTGDKREARNESVARPYSLTAFRFHAGIKRQWADFRNDYSNRSASFCEVINAIEDAIRTQQVENALVGNYKENLVARLNGISDNVHQEVTAKIEERKELSVEEAKAFLEQIEKEI